MLERRRRPGPGLAIGLICGLVAARPADAGPDEAGHPLVPGFERFYTAEGADAARGGRLLLGELNCLSCHRPDAEAEAQVLRKQAPILDDVGGRVRPGYLRAFLGDPRGVKPGTTMPDLLANTPEAERAEKVEALVHFLASTGGLAESSTDRRAIARGKVLYHRVGCVACHGPQDDDGPAARLSTSAPLGDLAAKYTIAGLARFLRDPLRVRPSGRMPGLMLNPEESNDLAHFLLRALRARERPNFAYRYFEGSWSTLPDLATLKPVASGRAVGLDLSKARRPNNFAMEFSADLRIDRDGDYTFHLSSDDGSKLWIDGRLVVDDDGIHPTQEKSERVELKRGTHRLVLAYFDAGGEAELDLEFEGPRLRRRSITSALVTEEPAAPDAPDRGPFRVDPGRAEAGRALFASIGCASCHTLREDGKPIASTLAAAPLAGLKGEGGCLDRSHAQGRSMYGLSEPQRRSLAEALKSLAGPAPAATPGETVSRVLTAFNCYACHRRGGLGGVEEARDPFFETTQKEMGDEGRLPPPLDGVGAKLTPEYLKRMFAEGAKDRPYMRTRMPRFGASNLGALVEALASADPIEPVEAPTFDLPARSVKSAGRFLAGGEALGCIKCHTFKGIEAEGVQAIDMVIMTGRLRRDWFHRYLIDPQAFRPGTRMPSAWPMGKSLLPKVLGGDARKQVEAIWQFLADGQNAREPYGLGRDPIPLVPEGEAVLYRNFIRGAGTRAIGVGYPERANLAFDANDLRIALIWQGAFIDAARHWSGRGEGYQPPLGDNVLALPAGPSLATLKSGTDPWPKGPAKDLGDAFRGYRLGKGGRPTFLYDVGPVHVEDRPEPIPGRDQKPASLRRTLTMAADRPVEDLWFRAAVGQKIEPGPDGRFTIDGEWTTRIESESAPIVRPFFGKSELLVPAPLHGKPATIVQEYAW